MSIILPTLLLLCVVNKDKYLSCCIHFHSGLRERIAVKLEREEEDNEIQKKDGKEEKFDNGGK